jgi:hypothetical protein
MSREAMQDGFFGSLEAALTTTADVALKLHWQEVLELGWSSWV